MYGLLRQELYHISLLRHFDPDDFKNIVGWLSKPFVGFGGG